MKLLIGYDGSESADASLAELTRAGLDKNVEALILVDEVWLPSSPTEFSRAVSARRMLAAESYSFVPALRAVEEGRALSRQALRRARSLFPDWDLRVDVSHGVGSPASELVRKAASWEADLIVIGSDSGHMPQAGFGGEALRKVIADAPCSVRLARTKSRAARGPVRLLVAANGTSQVMSAARAIAAREWPEGSECRFVETSESIGASAALAAATLRASGLRVSVVEGNGPLHKAVMEEAHDWEADCVFVGADENESLIGTGESARLAATLALSSSCSVELSRAVKREPERQYLAVNLRLQQEIRDESY
ncbi:MAG TPA: universal stress protein [Pyrinomonadaceae bacterium]|nr:universal stress protein [Pyrinomonadaceae bacterium]